MEPIMLLSISAGGRSAASAGVNAACACLSPLCCICRSLRTCIWHGPWRLLCHGALISHVLVKVSFSSSRRSCSRAACAFTTSGVTPATCSARCLPSASSHASCANFSRHVHMAAAASCSRATSRPCAAASRPGSGLGNLVGRGSLYCGVRDRHRPPLFPQDWQSSQTPQWLGPHCRSTADDACQS